MKSSTNSRWIAIRQDLYRQVQSYARALLGGETPELARYRRDYEKEFAHKWQVSQRKNLVKILNQRKYIFLGDFHALQQSQKSHLRILKSIKDPKNLIVAVEFFNHGDQTHLDAYVSGKYSDKDLLKAIDWEKKWGFPWENYKAIVKWCTKNNVKIVGLNTKFSDLKKRDRKSAEIIAKIRLQNPHSQIAIIFGDLHLAEHHLPAQVAKATRTSVKDEALIIYQNSEKIYFELLKHSREDVVDLVMISSYKFCLNNVPPWVKWQSYLIHLEQNFDIANQDSDIDYTDYVIRYAKILAADFEVPENFDHVSIYSAEDSEFWGKIEDNLGVKEKKWLKSYIQNGVSFYIPQLGIGFLARTTVNHAASLAMAIVHQRLSGHQVFACNMPKDFLRLIWQEAIQYFGSKFINPKRKTDTLTDIRLALAAGLTYDQGKEALNLALKQKMQELLHFSNSQRIPGTASVKQLISFREAARLLGGMLGEKLYFAYRHQLISKQNLKSLLKKNIEEKNFDQIYYEIIELIESFPEPFQSKVEKL